MYDAKQRTMMAVVGILGLLIVLVGGMATGVIPTNPSELAAVSSGMDSQPAFNPRNLYASALLEYERGNYVEARALANRLAYLKPKFVGAFKLLAAISLNEQNYRYALDECQKALALNPTDYTTKISLAAAYKGLGRVKEAVAVYQEVLNSPNAAEGYRKEAALQLTALGEKVNKEDLPETVPATEKPSEALKPDATGEPTAGPNLPAGKAP